MLHPQRRLFTREELEQVVARLDEPQRPRQLAHILKKYAEEFDYRVVIAREGDAQGLGCAGPSCESQRVPLPAGPS